MNPPSTRPRISPFPVILPGILAVSTASIFIKLAQVYAGSLVIAAYRLTLATLVLTPVALGRHRAALRRLTRRDLGLATLSGVLLAAHFATWVSSLKYTSVASSVVIVTTSPLWVALLAPITLREPLRWPVSMGLLVALAGGIIVGLSDSCTLSGLTLTCPEVGVWVQGEAFLGNFLALCGALAGAGYLLIGRDLRAKVPLVAYIFVVYGIAAGVLIGLMLGFGESPFGYPPLAFVWFLLLALIPQLLGHSSFNWALGYLPAAFVSITLLGEPVGSTVLAYFILKESPGLAKVFGAILILAGIYLASSRTRGKPQEEPQPAG